MYLVNFFQENLRLVPEIILLTTICVLFLFGLIYERSKNLPQVSAAITNMSIVVLFFLTIFFVYFFQNHSAKLKVFRFKAFAQLLGSGPYVFLSKLIVVVLILLCFISFKYYLQFQKYYYFEVPILFLCVLFGSFLIISANDLVVFYLGIEVISLSFYVLIGSKKNEQECLEAGLKYFILSSVASALIIMGSCVLYSIAGTTNLDRLSDLYNYLPLWNWSKYRLGSILLLIGIFYKLALFPFHYWVGDVYVGSPGPVVMVMSSVAKYPIIFFLIKYSATAISENYLFMYVFLFIGLFSVIFGSFYAFSQTNVKRLLGYGSIVHSGFILLSIAMYTSLGNSIALIYTIIYAITSVAFFNFFLSTYVGIKRKMYIDVSQYYGLFFDRPKLALSVSLIFFSFMGIPPLVGFFGKFFVLFSVADVPPYAMITLLSIISGVGAFYYFRFTAGIFFYKRVLFYSEPILAWKNQPFSYFVFCLLVIFLITGSVFMAKLFNYTNKLPL